jgi:hypothetical protein
MVSLVALWFPVLLSAVLIFAASWVIHMLLKYHNEDFSPLPGESNVLEALRNEGVGPGDYAFPCPASLKEMQSSEMVKKYEQGPVGFLTVAPNGPPAMGANLFQWFVYAVVIGILVAYVASRTVAPGAEYLQVFRVAGAVAFIGYAGAHPVASIWGKRRWSTTVKHILDSLVYALLTAGAFGGFWPE